MNLMKSLFAAVCVVLVAGCSVQQKDAQNKPPVIPNELKSFSTEYGTLEISSFNSFLAPEFKSYSDRVDYYNQLTRFKGKIAHKQFDADKMTGQVLQAKANFIADCAVFAASPEDFDATEGSIRNWKEAAGPREAIQIAKCQKNMEDRKGWVKRQLELGLEILNAQEDLKKFSDPDYGSNNPDNYKLIKVLLGDDSKIKIKESGAVDVELNGFCFEDNNQSTKQSKTTVEGAKIANAVYIRGKQILTFTVPEVKKFKKTQEKRDEAGNPVLDENGKPVMEEVEYLEKTGNALLFQLGRAADSYDSASFSGKMKLIDSSGNVLREGRAIVGGKLN